MITTTKININDKCNIILNSFIQGGVICSPYIDQNKYCFECYTDIIINCHDDSITYKKQDTFNVYTSIFLPKKKNLNDRKYEKSMKDVFWKGLLEKLIGGGVKIEDHYKTGSVTITTTDMYFTKGKNTYHLVLTIDDHNLIIGSILEHRRYLWESVKNIISPLELW